MPDHICIRLNGSALTVPAGVTVAVAILMSGEMQFRTSVSGQPRGPLCGMGICYECRVTIDGEAHARSCQIIALDGMEILT